MEHVGVGEDDVAPRPDGLAGVLGGVAVIGEDADLLGKAGVGVVELGPLVVREGLRREKVQGPAGRLLEDGVEHREVVAERFPGRRGRYDDDVLLFPEGVPAGALVGIEPVESFLP